MKVELLAPAGSYESMTAAFAAGADAVYIGGTRFGARAYADNPDEEMLKKAIDHAHLRGKKLYLTVNTLLKEWEMEELYGYLNPFYREGLDAVIVQDTGVLRFVKREFPDMDIHASTQMTITGACGAMQMKEAGASRIVTARELSLKEIKNIHRNVDIEIESFIHGALCYCYSGQCLYSSMIGGRSGNRGRCAQPCRLAYDLTEQGEILNPHENKYLLSPKDMCTLEILPQLLESGIYSLKIEGRMKRAEYTAGVVSIYRKYLDKYLQNPHADYQVSKEDISRLMDLYNRGGFSNGYYMQHNGADMMSSQRPNHWGTKAAKVTGGSSNTLKCRALETLNSKDVLECRNQKKPLEFVMDRQIEKGEVFSLRVPGNIKGKPDVLYRTRNEALLKEISHQFLEGKYQGKINGKLILSGQKCAILAINFGNVQVTVTGDIPQRAQNRPLRREDVEKQLRKTGGTEFCFHELEIEMEDGLFMPMQALNELRRKGMESLRNAVIEKSRRSSADRAGKCGEQDGGADFCVEQAAGTDLRVEQAGGAEHRSEPYMAVSLETKDGFSTLLRYQEVKKIYLDSAFFENRADLLAHAGEFIQQCHEKEKECCYVMPWIFRDKAQKYYEGSAMLEALEAFDGILVKSIDEYQFLKRNSYKKPLAADYNLYTWNREARRFWKEQNIAYDTAPLELNAKELKDRGCTGSEMLVYGYLPLMVSAQCQLKNTKGCSKFRKTVYLRDRKQKLSAVRNQCTFCYNLIYNSTPLELSENAGEVLALHPLGVRVQFTAEDEKKIAAVTEAYIKAFCKREPAGRTPEEFTRGHFKRGVE